MMDSLDELRRIYHGLNDEALLEMNREELTEVARICYDAELTERGIRPKPSASPGANVEPPPTFPSESGEMVVAAVFLVREEAKLAQALLESENIPAHVADDYADVNARGLTGFRLFVPAFSLDLARALMQTKVSEEDLAAQAEPGEIASEEGE
jgi:hypothetical protein